MGKKCLTLHTHRQLNRNSYHMVKDICVSVCVHTHTSICAILRDITVILEKEMGRLQLRHHIKIDRPQAVKSGESLLQHDKMLHSFLKQDQRLRARPV